MKLLCCRRATAIALHSYIASFPGNAAVAGRAVLAVQRQILTRATRHSVTRALALAVVVGACVVLAPATADAQGDSLPLVARADSRLVSTDTVTAMTGSGLSTASRRELRALNAILDAGLPSADMKLGQMPSFQSLNPSMVSRSGLMTRPYVLPRPGWSVLVTTSYANVIEHDFNAESRHLLDAEVARAEVEVRRDLSSRVWIGGAVGALSSFAGRFDGFLDWYHDLIGFPMWERDLRPSNTYADTLVIANRTVRGSSSGGTALSDVRLEGGYRWSPDLQTVVSLTVPTAPSSNLDHRGVVTASVIQTLRGRLGERMVMEFSGGGGYSARTGAMSEMQRRWHAGGSFSTRLRLTGGHALYGIVFYHSAPYFETGLRTQDSGELSTDFGYIFRTRDGREVRIGMTEDIYRLDHGVDVGLRVSVMW